MSKLFDDYNSLQYQANGKVPITRGCYNKHCWSYQEIIGWRDKLPCEIKVVSIN